MTDSDFAANASGVAMKYKLMGLENATSKKESYFKKGLQRRLELLTNMLNMLGNAYDYRAINITFTRNIPSNMVEMADVISKVGHLYSEETQMELMPFDIDIEAEQKRKEGEAEAGYSIDFDTEPAPLA
jgi:SPP1 family phage portal protein